ncbi:Rieske 2Fe-2S domain-containing protein [Nocardia jinanensis]|uniref:cholesterol 7-desaturase n=1 Tax=Nocardia jinanensis TaxID=382504 RepID=A0A917VTT5_9NOCA|nr:Rieske 2Fe-2S domain-containing protein [Nocardia jinanensis]GGL13466.1 (2Fe-2S)-binding protein [Nocardia jinanensis]
MQSTLSVKPTGWFQIGWSAEFGPDAVVGKRYFGHDLVAYRGRDGEVHVLDAYCQHLGANLACGGKVVDEGLQCPYHGWVWNSAGRNVHIPYQPDRPNKVRRVRSWHAAERAGQVFLWHDVSGRPPLWELPDDPFEALGAHIEKESFHPPRSAHFPDLRIHPRIPPENAVDPHHFRFVHGTPMSPVVLEEHVDDWTWHSRVGFGRRWADGSRSDETLGTIVIHWSGIGVSWNGEHTRSGVRVVAICLTPVDDEHSEIFATYWLAEREDDSQPGVLARRYQEIENALPDDINIWNNQIYLDPPGLAASEAAGFRKLRQWVLTFFPDDETGTVPHAEKVPAAR